MRRKSFSVNNVTDAVAKACFEHFLNYID